jgi:hypothetical protein
MSTRRPSLLDDAAHVRAIQPRELNRCDADETLPLALCMHPLPSAVAVAVAVAVHVNVHDYDYDL